MSAERDRRAAAEQLRRILAELEPTGSERDERVRAALATAAGELEDGSDPAAALEAVQRQHYGRRVRRVRR